MGMWDCDFALNRRSFLAQYAGGLGGLALAQLLTTERARAADDKQPPARPIGFDPSERERA